MGARRAVTGAALVAIAAIATSSPPDAAEAAFPGDNGRIAYAAAPRTELDTHVVTVLPDGSGSRRLTRGASPSWSADGGHLVLRVSDGRLVTIGADGGDETTIAGNGGEPSFSPNGRRIVYTTENAIRTIRIDGTEPRLVVKRAHGGSALESPQYSPSGKRIAFAGQPKGKKSSGIWRVRRSGSRLRRLTNPHANGPEFADASPNYSPDGQHIIFTRFGFRCCYELRVMRADGSRERRILGTGDADGFPADAAYAPAGDRMAVVLAQGNYLFGFCSDLYTMSPDGSDRDRLTNNCNSQLPGDLVLGPSWQPLPGAQ